MRRLPFIILIFVLFTLLEKNVICMSKNETAIWRDRVKDMFMHAYNSYMNNAFPQDELKPLSCTGMKTWGNYSLTLVDALDSLYVVGETQEFINGVRYVIDNINFDYNLTVSVFETNIRILGGLLSTHMLLKYNLLKSDDVDNFDLRGLDKYQDELLSLAADLGDRLLLAFDTETGIPFGMVNLKYGVPIDESIITSTAGAGTFLIEFGVLSSLTGDPKYLRSAKIASQALFERRSKSLGLVGNHINIRTGAWTHRDAGIGASVDSYYEYLFKSYQLFHDEQSLSEFQESYQSIMTNLHKSPWYYQVDMMTGHTTWPLYNSLQSFWPGIQAQYGVDIQKAQDTLLAFHGVWRRYGAVPEGYNLLGAYVQPLEKGYPLRPELVESIYYMYRVTQDPMYKMMGRDIVTGLEINCKTECGFANIKDVETMEKDDRMESFFLSETLKYLYLLYDDDNFVNNCEEGDQVEGYVMNTEAHLMPIHKTVIEGYQEALRYINDGYVSSGALFETCPVPKFFSPLRFGICQMHYRGT
ncbi:ER degradation enhancer, mannosidase alpha-like [Acrasis kona]|uniref:alpha-1,2-Mannosidase n=1 Tax=Acrasis kona TaxID=1008807 RepID=A0AAW2YLV7_9EUKA